MEQLPSVTWALVSAFTAIVLGIITMGLFAGNQFPVDGKTILITGASEGMGLSAARMLAAKGANLVIVSRSVQKLETAMKEIRAAAKDPASQRFHYIAADVAVPSYAGPVVAEAIQWNGGKTLDIVWCIAGMATPELFLDMEMSSMRQQMDVNFYGTAEMCHAILKEWLDPAAPVEKQPKHLVLTASTAAFAAVAGYSPYAPSKFALRGLVDTLAQEVMLYPQNVKVSMAFPGGIMSPGHARENLTKPGITHILEKDDPKQSPDECAECAIRGLERGGHFVTMNFIGHLLRWGALGSSIRNNWFIDTIGAWLASIVWFFVQMDMHSSIRKYAKEHGHPSQYNKGNP